MKLNILKTITFGILILLVTSCSSDKSASTNLEKITFPTTEFTISANADTTIFGQQGTRLFIEKGTFQFADGTPVLDSIKVELKEFYKKSEILLANLSTESSGKLLETGGMLNITATSNGKIIEIKNDKRIVVHFPKQKNSYKQMNLFYADKNSNDSTVSNWSVDTINLIKKTLQLGAYGWQHIAFDDSTEFKFKPKNYVDTGYYWNPMNLYVNSANFSEQAMKEIGAYKKGFGVECEMTISTNGHIQNPKINANISRPVKDELLNFLKKLPELEPGRNKKGEVVERIGYLDITGGNIIPLYKSREEYIRSFDKKYSKFEKNPIRNMDEAELEYYIFSVSKLGWINCDRFLESEKTIDLMVQIPSSAETKIKMAFKDINGVLMASEENNKYVFTKVPVGRQVTIFAIKYVDGQIHTAFEDITISNKPLENLVFQETSIAELKRRLEKLN